MIALGISPATGDGSNKVFTLSALPINLVLFAGGQLRTDYSLAGLVATFVTAPSNGEGLNAFADGTFPAAAAPSAVASVARETTSELIASLRQRTFTSAAARDFPDASCLRAINENINTYLLKLIAKRRTNYLVESTDVAFSGGNSTGIPIPSVAMAGALRAVTFLIGGLPYPLVEMDLSTAVAGNLAPLSSQFPSGYYFMGPYIVPWPTPSISGILRLHYHRRPSTLVLESQCIQITAFPGGAAAGNYRVQFASLPAGFTGGTLIDVVSNSPNFYRWQTSLAIQAITSTTLDIPGPQPANLAVGDWICIAGTAPVVTDAPAEVLDALLQAAACDMMAAKGASDTYSRMVAQMKQKEEDCGPLIQVRNTGAQRKISAFPDAVAGFPWG